MINFVLESSGLGKTLSFATLSSLSDPDIKKRKHSHKATLSMGRAGVSRKSPNDAHWLTQSVSLSRPISAPLLTLSRAPAEYLHHS